METEQGRMEKEQNRSEKDEDRTENEQERTENEKDRMVKEYERTEKEQDRTEKGWDRTKQARDRKEQKQEQDKTVEGWIGPEKTGKVWISLDKTGKVGKDQVGTDYGRNDLEITVSIEKEENKLDQERVEGPRMRMLDNPGFHFDKVYPHHNLQTGGVQDPRFQVQ